QLLGLGQEGGLVVGQDQRVPRGLDLLAEDAQEARFGAGRGGLGRRAARRSRRLGRRRRCSHLEAVHRQGELHRGLIGIVELELVVAAGLQVDRGGRGFVPTGAEHAVVLVEGAGDRRRERFGGERLV